MFNASESHSSPAGVCVSSESAATQCTSAQPDRVIVFAGFPEAGQAKTQLIPALGPERAARLQAALTRRTLNVTRQICLARQRNLEVRFAGGRPVMHVQHVWSRHSIFGPARSWSG